MSVPQRYGITVPFDGVPLHAHREWYEEIDALGYTDLWSAESGGADAFTPLALAAAWTPSLRLGTAIVPAFTRGAATLAESVASMVQAAPGRFALGIGTSSNVIVENWNGVPFEEPYRRVRDTIRFLRSALAGEKVTQEYDTFAVKGFRLGIRIDEMPPILVAALRPGMLRLAGREGDGAIINWLSADDVRRPSSRTSARTRRSWPASSCCRPRTWRPCASSARARSPPTSTCRYTPRSTSGSAAARWQPMWDAWKAGDREAATKAIPDELIDDLIVHGSPAQIREKLARYAANGVTTPAPAVMAGADDARRALREAAPNAA